MLVVAVSSGLPMFHTVLLSNEKLLLLRREITPPQLIFADPSEDFFPAFKRERHGGKIKSPGAFGGWHNGCDHRQGNCRDTHRRVYLFTSFCVCHIVDIHVRLHDFESQIPNDFRIQSKPTKCVFRFWVRLFGGLIRCFSHSPIR